MDVDASVHSYWNSSTSRNMAPLATCCLCHSFEDDWWHAILGCAMAQSVWALFGQQLTEHICINQCRCAKERIFFLIESLSHGSFVKTVVVLWAILVAHQKAVHVETFQIPLPVYTSIGRFMSDLDIAHILLYNLGLELRNLDRRQLNGFPCRGIPGSSFSYISWFKWVVHGVISTSLPGYIGTRHFRSIGLPISISLNVRSAYSVVYGHLWPLGSYQGYWKREPL